MNVHERGKKLMWPILTHYPGICLESTRKTMITATMVAFLAEIRTRDIRVRT